MGDWVLHVRVGPQIAIEDSVHLASTLDRLHLEQRDDPILVHLEGPEGILTIGVGPAMTILTHTLTSGNPPYFSSLGTQTEGPDLVFDASPHPKMEGDYTEFDIKHAVPWKRAKQAMLDYFATSRLGPAIEWVEV